LKNASKKEKKFMNSTLSLSTTSTDLTQIQLLIDNLFQHRESYFASLTNHYELPREKKLSLQKHETRWEKFSKEKGIQKVRKSRMEWNEERAEYVPRYGFKGNTMEGWLTEEGEEDKKKVKKENIEKNDKRRQRNEDERLAGGGAVKRNLQKRIVDSRKSTASLGRFDKQMEGDVKVKGLKRKFDSNTRSVKEEMEVMNQVVSKDGKVKVNKKKAIKMLK
jgi:regulator of ribosome biosynthesis